MVQLLDNPASVRRVAMDLLARREHSSAELTRKLRQRGVAAELIQPVLARLAEEGLLSDSRYLESLIRRRALAGYGPQRIRDELSQQGFATPEIRAALQGSEFDWFAQLHSVWQRKFAGQHPQSMAERAKQIRFLAYRGFSAEMISRLWRAE